MKKTILLFGFLTWIALLSGQSYATFRLGSTDASTLSPGDQVYVPVYCDDISGPMNCLQMLINFDHNVLDWNGSFANPLPGVQNFHPNFPYGTPIGSWMFNDNGTSLTAIWDSWNLGSINPGETFFELIFTYLGGETILDWGPNSGCCSIMTLINGCVCNPIAHPIVFHIISSTGNLIENAAITVENETLLTNEAGNAAFYRTDGNYSYTVTKEGFASEEGTFTVSGAPQLIEVEMEECWDIVLHLIDSNGTTITDSALVIVNNDTVWTTTGSAAFCITDLTINYEVYIEGYYPNIGGLTIPPFPGTIEIIMLPFLYNVTFFVNCCGEPLESISITYEGQTVMTNVAGLAILNMPAGFYSFEIEGVPVTFTVPDTVYVPVDICSEVTFSLTCQGIPLVGALVTIDSYLQQITNANGIAFFCLQNGIHQYEISKPGYDTIVDGFNVNNEPLLIENDLCFYWPEVTLFVNCCGAPLEGIPVIIDGYTLFTPANGLVVLILPPGSYTIEIGGYIFNFTVPGTTYLDADICRELTYHVTTEQGYPLENVLISMGPIYLLTDYNGEADTCLQVGSYNYSASKPGFITQTGNFEMDTIPQTVEILMLLESYAVTFYCSVNCENDFNGLIFFVDGDTVLNGGTIYLPDGIYNFEMSFEGCPNLFFPVSEAFIVSGSPLTIVITLPPGFDFPQVTFHVTDQFYDDFHGAVVNVEEDILITDTEGMASFCMTGGYHEYWVANPGYDTVPNNFIFPCQDTTIEVMLIVGSIKEEKMTLMDIYPNPSTGLFTIENLNRTVEPTEIFVTDITGRIVYQTITSNLDKTEIDLTDQPNGMYFVRVKAGELVVNGKVIVQ